MSYISEVKNFIVENFLFGELGDLDENTSLLESGTIDSTGVLELVTFLESTYNISIKDEDLIPENLDSLNNIAGFLSAKLEESPLKAVSNV